MNTNLIPVFESTINSEVVQTVNARELHAFLESKQDFSTWIKARINQYEFVENQDFIRFHRKMEANNATLTDYHVSIDVAKELAMVERNAKGKEARQYFIAIEKAYREQQPKELTKEQILVMALESERERLRLAAEVEVMTPKAEYYDRLIGCHDTHDGEYVAKLLRTSVRKLFALLRNRGVLTKNNLPMQLYIDKDYMRIQQEPYERLGMQFVSSKVVFTQRGVQYVRGIVDQFFREMSL
jgi:anti-repressor protein